MVYNLLSSLLERVSNVGCRGKSTRLFDGYDGCDRGGVNIVIEYVLAIAIIISFTGLLISGFSSTVSTAQEDVAQVELDQASSEIAVAIEDVDRMVANGETEYVQILVELPDTVGSEQYIIRVMDGVVSTETGIASGDSAGSEVEYDVDAPVDGFDGTTGGDVVILYDSSDGEIVVRSK